MSCHTFPFYRDLSRTTFIEKTVRLKSPPVIHGTRGLLHKKMRNPPATNGEAHRHRVSVWCFSLSFFSTLVSLILRQSSVSLRVAFTLSSWAPELRVSHTPLVSFLVILMDLSLALIRCWFCSVWRCGLCSGGWRRQTGKEASMWAPSCGSPLT